MNKRHKEIAKVNNLTLGKMIYQNPTSRDLHLEIASSREDLMMPVNSVMILKRGQA